jgi:WD40 repeat protein
MDKLAISQDNSKIAVIRNIIIRIWNIKTGQILVELAGHSDAILCMTISRPDLKIISGSRDRRIKIWDSEPGQLLKTLRAHNYVTCVAVSSNNLEIISGSDDGSIRIWDLTSGKLLYILEGYEHITNVLCCGFKNEIRDKLTEFIENKGKLL